MRNSLKIIKRFGAISVKTTPMQEKINILNELTAAGAVYLLNADNRNYFSLPVDYFDDLPENILKEVFIKSLPRINPYTLPDGYFENLSEQVIYRIFLNAQVSISDISSKEIYSVPEGYFDNLAGNILARINGLKENNIQKELEDVAPFLSTIPRTNVYSVPENYFNELSPAINVAGNTNKPSARVISIGSTARKWFNYTAAACIAAVIFAGGYLYFGKPGKTAPDSTFTALQKMDIQKEISGLTDDQIRNYLKDNNKMAVYTNSSFDDGSQQMDIENMLQNISDDEIQQYLKDDPESAQVGEGI